VSQLARQMVTEWGMSDKVGLVTYGSDNPIFLGRDMGEHNNYSDNTAALIDSEVHAFIQAEFERAEKLLSEHMTVLDNMSRVLIEKETIYTDEVEMLMNGSDYKEVVEYMDNLDKKDGVEKEYLKRFE
jgi:cell division protease FtsH